MSRFVMVKSGFDNYDHIDLYMLKRKFQASDIYRYCVKQNFIPLPIIQNRTKEVAKMTYFLSYGLWSHKTRFCDFLET